MTTALTFPTHELQRLLSDMHFANAGDAFEQRYWPTLNDRFPNCERFWQQLVIPMTTRIERNLSQPGRRAGTDEHLWSICYLNYSVFLHLGYAYDHLSLPLPSSFGDFYTHLSTTCDLAEDLIANTYVLVSECSGTPVPVLQLMSKDEVLVLAGQWYDKEYAKAYEHYHAKGKAKPLYLPPRARVVHEYMKDDEEANTAWRTYARCAQALRTYRNRIVHDVELGEILIPGATLHLVPRPAVISKYPRLRDVFGATSDPIRTKRDFVIREDQMVTDFRELSQRLNELWILPMRDLVTLLYERQNPLLMEKYNLMLV